MAARSATPSAAAPPWASSPRRARPTPPGADWSQAGKTRRQGDRETRRQEPVSVSLSPWLLVSPRERVIALDPHELAGRKCVPCEGGVPPLPEEQVRHYLAAVPAWQLNSDGNRIARSWRVKDFLTALDFFQRIAH